MLDARDASSALLAESSPLLSSLGNISTRGLVQTGDSVMIGGFIIHGTQPKEVIVRAIGPALTGLGVANALSDPTLELHDATGAVIASNDDWQTTQIGGVITADQVSDIQNSQLAPTQATESAIIAALQPGNYTAIVRGANDSTGIALVEAFDMDPQVTSVAETAPVALTPLSLTTIGIDPTKPTTVNFYNSLGYSVSAQPLRIDADGTVVVAVPLYVDPISNIETAGTVSMTLTQENRTSTPMSIDIQDIPTIDSYGTQPGEITHAVLVFEAELLARRLNQLQAFQVLPGNTVDTSVAQSILASQLSAAIQARSDVDRVMVDNSVVINAGTLPDGTPIQFDKNALDIMDRLNALFLLQTVAPYVPSSGMSSLAPNFASQSPLLPGAVLKSVLDYVKTATGVAEIENSVISTTNAQNWTAVVEAVGTGLSSVADLLPKGVITESSDWVLGAGGSIISNADIVTGALVDDGFYIYGAVTGDQNLMNTALEAMNSLDSAKLRGAAIGLTLTLLGNPEAGVVLNDVSTVGSFIQSFFDLKDTIDEADKKYQEVDAEYPMPFSSDTEGIALIEGNAQISNSLGIQASQTGIDLCCLGDFASEMQGIADPSGDFSLYVPLEADGTDYSNLTVSAYDPLTGTILSAEAVDLSGLDTMQPVIVPTLIGTCDDSDAGDPDGDDPDCD